MLIVGRARVCRWPPTVAVPAVGGWVATMEVQLLLWCLVVAVPAVLSFVASRRVTPVFWRPRWRTFDQLFSPVVSWDMPVLAVTVELELLLWRPVVVVPVVLSLIALQRRTPVFWRPRWHAFGWLLSPVVG